jgi:hypothetical protein
MTWEILAIATTFTLNSRCNIVLSITILNKINDLGNSRY